YQTEGFPFIDSEAHVVNGFDDRVRAEQATGSDEMLDETRNVNERHQLDRTNSSVLDDRARRRTREAGLSCTDRSDSDTVDERRNRQEASRASVRSLRSPEAVHHGHLPGETRAVHAYKDVADFERLAVPVPLRRCVRRT